MRTWVPLADIEHQRQTGWPDFHPEDYCHRCGGSNVYSWHAPDDLWETLRLAGVMPDSEILCPQCFTSLIASICAEQGTKPPTVWKLLNADAHP